MKEINSEEEVKNFIRKYKRDYWFGRVLGEELFTKMFGYLNPTVPFEELRGDDVDFLLKSEDKQNEKNINDIN